MGPGDNIVVQLYGKENGSYALTVNREGQIQFPEISNFATKIFSHSPLVRVKDPKVAVFLKEPVMYVFP